jgi:hypothetical protein
MNELAMKDLLEKLSSYNIFNYLFPGVLVAVLGTAVSSYHLLADDIVVGVFLYYFYGLVVSRIGSLVLEPFLKWVRIIRFAPYADFVAASRIDEKIDTLSEQNNVYRTLASTFLCLTLLGLADWVFARLPLLFAYRVQIAVLLLLALFIWSYRKQTNYVSARVKAALRSKPPGEATDSRAEQ